MASRVTFIILMLLATGFVVNIAMAWGLAYWDTRSPEFPRSIHISAPEGPCWIYEVFVKPGWRQVRAIAVPLEDSPRFAYAGGVLAGQFENPFESMLLQVDDRDARWSGLGTPPEVLAALKKGQSHVDWFRADARGFPIPCLASRYVGVAVPSFFTSMTPDFDFTSEQMTYYVNDALFNVRPFGLPGERCEFGIDLSPTATNNIPGPQLRILPLRPIWSGMVFNTVVYAIALGSMLMMAMLARGRWRQIHRHCPRCNYDLQADVAAGCPECGWRRKEEEEPCSEPDV